MESTPLQLALRETLPGGGIPPLAAYRGVETASRYADPRHEFFALSGGCGVYDMGFRSRIQLTGSDRVRWLNGMVTNNIRDLATGSGVYAFLLNPQGRILGDMNVFNRGESLVVETDLSQMSKFLATFEHYIVMDDVEARDISREQSTLGLSGPGSRAVLNAVGIEVPQLEPMQMATPRCVCDCDCLECTVIRGADAPQESYELWLAPKDLLKTWRALVAHGATAAGSEAVEMQRVAAGIPLYGVDIRERDLPQETEQIRALNFNKGCYVGQEIVERIRSRGNVHRQFSGFLMEGAQTIAAGTKITSGEKEVGEVTSSVIVPRPGEGSQTIVLGYIRREAALPGQQIKIAAASAEVIRLPGAGPSARPSEVPELHKV